MDTLAPFDFYNPFMAAAIVNSQGKRVPLWTNAKNAQGKASTAGGDAIDLELSNGLVSLPFLQDLRVTTNLGEYPIIKAVLTPPYREAIAFLDSKLVEWGTSTLEVQLGYIYGTQGLVFQSPVYKGVLLKPDIKIGPQTTITLNAQGVGAFSMARQESGRQLSNIARLDVVQEILNANQVGDQKIALDNESIRKLDSRTRKLLLEEKINFSQGYKTDLQAIWDVIKEAEAWPVFIEGKLVIVARGRLNSKPKFVLSLYDFEDGLVGPDVGVFPILNASSPTMAVYLPSSQFGFLYKGINSSTSSVDESEVSDDGQASTGAGVANSTGLNRDAGRPAYLADINNPRAAAQAKQEYERTRTGMGINLDLDTLGNPNLLPGDVVNVRGLGSRISGPKYGNYGVFSVTHVFNNSGFMTSINCVSNTAAFGRSAGDKAKNLNQKTVSDISPSYKGTILREPEEQLV